MVNPLTETDNYGFQDFWEEQNALNTYQSPYEDDDEYKYDD